jgi:hypothetical protein
MTVGVAGVAQRLWCPEEALASFGNAWRSADVDQVVCDAPGVYFAGGAMRVVLPRCYSSAPPSASSASSSLNAALLLLRVMAKYRGRRSQRSVVGDDAASHLREIGGIDDELAWLDVALQLLADADEHGPIVVAEPKTSPRERGRVHWAVTQQRALHIVDGPNIVSDPLWQSRRAINPLDELTQLHGDTFSSLRSKLTAASDSGAEWTAHRALAVLDRRERSLFSDRHRRVARWLRQLWTQASMSPTSRQSRVAALWAPAFPMIWEAMLRDVMRGRPLELPSGAYKLSTGDQAGLRLIPDFVVDHGGVRFIIDAKHYSLEDLPRSESITKQLLYRWFASTESSHGTRPIADIISVFALPSVGRASCELLGRHELAGEMGERDFGRIWVIAADYERVGRAYLDAVPSPPITGVLSEISDALGSATN